MIALDTSAIAAIALEEREARVFAELIGSEACIIGWPTILECHMVLKSIPFRRGLDVLDMVLGAPRLRIVAFDRQLFESARTAFDRFGRGYHKAKLNFGDCMSYAVAKLHEAPLLFKGDDFPLTDIRAAL
ncbi:MAG: type II toxin-antitoxin system VapC family toxin [Alphaproteobacteria bacterium]|nr:MAG: type II toxin-antitoxin system VapC family toxin [Alphaproteobacteria bacterium]